MQNGGEHRAGTPDGEPAEVIAGEELAEAPRREAAEEKPHEDLERDGAIPHLKVVQMASPMGVGRSVGEASAATRLDLSR